MQFEFLQVRSNCLLKYIVSDAPHRGRLEDLQKEKSYGGTVTAGAKKRMLTALDFLVQRSPKQRIFNQTTEKFFDFRLNFITLTVTNSKRLIEAHEAYEALLSKTLIYFKRKFGVKDYLWKAEKQKNGQIHYHIASNTFLPQNFVRWKWNKVCKEEGLLDTFAKQYGHFNPASTEVTSIVHVQDAKAYIAKEFAKKEGKDYVVKGKVWDANDELKRKMFSENMTAETFYKIQGGVLRKEIIVKSLEDSRCELYLTPSPEKYLSDKMKARYKEYISL